MSEILHGKTVVLGISGGIAAYKCPELVRLLVKEGADVHCILTNAGAQFVTPLTLQTVSKNVVHREMFDLIDEKNVGHIALADRADILLIAPATADIIAKIAHGICDDLLSTVVCATKAPVIFAPAMNVNMWENKITQRNISMLRELGYKFIEPEEGELACGYDGKGRMADISTILETIANSPSFVRRG